MKLYDLQRGRCCWCGRSMKDALAEPHAPRHKKYTIDHIRPIARYGTNWPWNLVLACQHCNGSHHAKLVFTEWQPPDMLPWMRDYLIRSMILDVIWQVWLWKIKIGFRLY